MDLIRIDGRIIVAGPDTAASVSQHGAEPLHGLRFRPGMLPRLLGVPAAELRNGRVPLTDLGVPAGQRGSLVELTAALASVPPSSETAPWSMALLGHVTRSFAGGASVARVADQIGWSSRTLQRQCTAVYGYAPATLRRILRFRRALQLIDRGASYAEAAAAAGYSDQPHLYREVRDLSGTGLPSLRQDSSGANRSTQLPSGSATVA
jgi:AraC-like DNA-binding protein